MDVPPEAAGLAGAAGFNMVIWLAYFVLCSALAITAGIMVDRLLFTLQRPGH